MTSFSFSLVRPSLQTTRKCLVSCYILTCLLAQSSDASDNRPSFPHLEPRFKALNITSGDEVNSLVRDWQAELNALDGLGGQGASMRLSENKVLEHRFAKPFLAERAPCIAPESCAFQGISYCCPILAEGATCYGTTLESCANQDNSLCCYSSYTCCYPDGCCPTGYSCCSNNPGLCCGPGQFCCNLDVVSATS
jgi:hypothetical protein